MLRNREIKLFVSYLLVIAVVTSAVGFAISVEAGLLSAAAALLFITLLMLLTRWRYRQLDSLNAYLKRINSGDYSLDVRDNTEGELSILKSELYKVTVMLRERNEILKRDKAALKNALSDISHQLKTPLTSLFVMTDLMCDANLPAQKRQAFTSRIHAQLERIDWLVAALLKLSRLDAKTVEFSTASVSAKALIDKACAPLLIPIELKSQSLFIHDDDTVIQCDANWTSEAILNIVKNCVEHTPEGGHIHIDCTQNPMFVQITIRDNGGGISKQDLPHIFNRFYRGHAASEDSVGIGLAMTHAIIEAQGGTVTARNGPNGGSLFEIRFPK